MLKELERRSIHLLSFCDVNVHCWYHDSAEMAQYSPLFDGART
jgi:hypothetical protein